MSESRPQPDLGFLDAAQSSRTSQARRRSRIAYGFSSTVTLVWFVAVFATGNFDRVWDNIVATPTMIAGSFVAGATPQGSAAISFPVFTKALGVESGVARTFGLCIQTIGMGSATVLILIRRTPISVPGILWSLPFGCIGLFAGFFLLSDRDTPFWNSLLPGPYVKVFFTLLVVAMAFVVFLGSRVPAREVRTSIEPLGRRQIIFLIVAALFGGLASSQVGSGIDVMLYLVLVVLLGLEARIAVPSSVIVMTAMSVIGFVYLGLIQGHLDVQVTGDVVTAVNGTPLSNPEDFPASRFDLLGLWMASVPVVCWFAPLGAAFAARITTRKLAVFVALLASAEGLTTVIFVEELRTDMGLVAFGLIGGAILVTVLYMCVQWRHRIADVYVDPSRSFDREGIDLAPGFVQRRPADSTPAADDADQPDEPPSPDEAGDPR